MPQLFQVLRCCSCELFQVHLVKKSKKWECKVCKEKQSLIKAYKIGTPPDCRSLVQQLNLKIGEEKSAQLFNGNSECSRNDPDLFEYHWNGESMAFSCDINDGSKIRSPSHCMHEISVSKTGCLSTSDFKSKENSFSQQMFKSDLISICKLNGVTEIIDIKDAEIDVTKLSVSTLPKNNESPLNHFTPKEKKRSASETFIPKCVTKRNRGFQKIVDAAKCQLD